jgi:hypothetical protein
MRDLLSKFVTGSLIAGSALLVVACGSNEDATNNTAALNVEETMPTNDMTTVDGMNGTDANIGAPAMDSNTATDTTVNTSETTTNTSSTTTNGM